jgi:GNAT superfamily N-acetyltransferase
VDDTHPLIAILEQAARGRFPQPDGGISVLPPPPGRSDAVVAFTAHHVIAADVDQDDVHSHLPSRDLGAPMSAPFLEWLAHRLGTPAGSLDVVLAAPGRPDAGADTILRDAGRMTHDRVDRAERYREEISVYTDPEETAVVVLGRGLAGRRELSLEIEEAMRGQGIGRRLLLAARALIPEEECVFAQVAAGNAASMRAFLAAGFTPICAEVLFLRGRASADTVGR